MTKILVIECELQALSKFGQGRGDHGSVQLQLVVGEGRRGGVGQGQKRGGGGELMERVVVAAPETHGGGGDSSKSGGGAQATRGASGGVELRGNRRGHELHTSTGKV